MKERIENLKPGTMIKVIHLGIYAICPSEKCNNNTFMVQDKEYVIKYYEKQIYKEVYESSRNSYPLALICKECNACNFLRNYNEYTYEYTSTFPLTI